MTDIVMSPRFRDALRVHRYASDLLRVANSARARWYEDAWTVRDVLAHEDRPWGRAYTEAMLGYATVRWRGCGPDVDQHFDIEREVRRLLD